ncbi:Aste57867_8699 [Aphanomyces stellatus]|uniref:Aste57867_8699 protein n=1 Tax=Aphanomyces stellatus TaxID=120398 RepID=A0A485KKX7_9STRA|nr:hypothetical protein As57867_008665 [Aphanomyces stellatus]VFT85585.1 Aste57867_8699 [Aphanomyces stellatus]
MSNVTNATNLTTATPTTVVWTFDPLTSGGVSGNITTVVGAASTAIQANLDLTGANWTALVANEGNCSINTPPTSFSWHIHTVWKNAKSSGFLGDCSLANAGNHYDPTYACGPNSEFIKDPKCAGATYNCTPALYAANASVCEKGDLSGHVGKMTATGGKIAATWTDKPNYPTVDEHNLKTWNIMLHAVCGSTTPRFVCAQGTIVSSDKGLPSTTYAPTVAGATTAAPSTTAKPSSAVKLSVVSVASLAILSMLF